MTTRTLTGIVFSLMWLGLAAPDSANSTVFNFIFEIKGEVQLKRSQWKGYRKANVGNLLNPSDQLRLGTGASAKIVCSNLSLWSLQGNSVTQVSDGCPSRILNRNRPNSTRVTPRAPNEKIPYVISPRNTALLTNRPILRWNAVPGAINYTVKLLSFGKEYWQTETTNTQIEYPAESPLEPDLYYLLVIEAKKVNQRISSEEEEGVDLLFKQLDEIKSQLLQSKISKVKQQKLTKDTEGLALAYLYQSYNLKAESIELLEDLVRESSQITGVYQLLGDFYLQIGLSQQAKEPYINALKLAKVSENVEGQAEAQAGLGEVLYSLGKTEEAIEWLQKAKKNYRTLGDDEKLQELDRRIDLISR